MTITELIKCYSLEIDKEVQRPFEWDNDCIRLFYDKNIIQEGLKFMDARDEYKPLSDAGTITIFKRTQGTSKDFFLDDGGHRVLASIVMFASINKIINEYQLQNQEECRELCAFISGAVKNAKINFIPHPSDEQDYKNILENDVKGKSKYSPHLTSAFFISYNSFKNLYLQNREKFFKVCDFITGYFSFQICQYEFTPMECRKIKYNEINNTKKDQNEIHRALSTLQEDASSLGVEGFIEKTLEAEKKIANEFPQKAADKKIHNPFLGRYLTCRLLSVFGELFTSASAKTKVDVAAKTIIVNGDEEKRINFYKTAYNDIDLFCNLWKKSIMFDMPASRKNNINMWAFASIEGALSALKQDHFAALTLRIVKSIFKINGTKITGVKECFDENIAWHLMRMLCLFRFYQLIVRSNGADTRQDLRPLLAWGETVETNEQLINYDNHFATLIKDLLDNDAYKTQLFAFKAKKDESKWLLAMINIDEDNFSESCYDMAIRFLDSNQSQIDHVIHAESELFKNGVSALSKKDVLGNLRLLPTTKNKQENNPKNLRIINQYDVAFPNCMRGKVFSIEDIDARQRWMADKIRRINERIYSCC